MPLHEIPEETPEAAPLNQAAENPDLFMNLAIANRELGIAVVELYCEIDRLKRERDEPSLGPHGLAELRRLREDLAEAERRLEEQGAQIRQLRKDAEAAGVEFEPEDDDLDPEDGTPRYTL